MACLHTWQHHELHSARHQGNRFLPCRLGSSIKLQTQLPPEYSDEELHELQQGECAACKQLLPLPGAKPPGWLRGSSHKVRQVA